MTDEEFVKLIYPDAVAVYKERSDDTFHLSTWRIAALGHSFKLERNELIAWKAAAEEIKGRGESSELNEMRDEWEPEHRTRMAELANRSSPLDSNSFVYFCCVVAASAIISVIISTVTTFNQIECNRAYRKLQKQLDEQNAAKAK